MATKFKVNSSCVSCRSCQGECPTAAIEVNAQSAIVDPGKCTGCGKCRDACANEALDSYEV